MTRSFLIFSLFAATVAASAAPFFYRDDFDGTALDPGWQFNPGGQEGSALMTYEVSGGYFRPTGWVLGSNPIFPQGSALMSRQLAPPGEFIGPAGSDFSVRVGMTLPVSPTHRSFDISLGDLNSASGMRISNFSGNQYLLSLRSNTGQSQQSPFLTLDPSLEYEFEMRSQGTSLFLLMNGQTVLTTTHNPTLVNRMQFQFGGNVGSEQSTRLNYIEVVPEPATAIVLGAAGAVLAARKRRKLQP